MVFMAKIFKVAIVGGGFSGMVAACRLAEAYGDNVVLIEKNERIGKKILSTGNGRGNVTNTDMNARHYHSVCGAKVSPSIEVYDAVDSEKWFGSIGVPFSYEGEKAYPSSKQASSLSDAMRAKLIYDEAVIVTAFKVVKITQNSQDVFSIMSADGREIRADIVILACGGKAGKQYGTDGDGYNLARGLGHTVTEIYPSLVQVKTEREKIRTLKGIKAEADVSAIVDGKETVFSNGDVLFTEYGLSGNAIFFISAYVTGRKNSEIKLSFLPEYSEEKLVEIIKNKILRLPYLTVDELLSGIINKQLGKAILKNLGISSINVRDSKRIAEAIKDMRLKVEGTLGFDYAQVTRGGVKFNEIDEKTFESKITKGLYFTGEILDVDGDCGGYNLQFAYSSATAAATNILEHEDR